MRRGFVRPAAALIAVAALSLAATSAAPSRGVKARGNAQAYAVRVVLPGSTATGTPQVSAPPDTVSLEGGFAYPEDGSIVFTGSATASASAAGGASSQAQASAEVASLSLFGGEVTATKVTARARASAADKGATGDTNGTAVAGLAALGQPAAGTRIQLGDWGYADVAASTAGRSSRARTKVFRAGATALAVHLTAAHGGLPAGAQIVVGSVESAAQVDIAPPPAQGPTSKSPKPPASKTLAPKAAAGKRPAGKGPAAKSPAGKSPHGTAKPPELRSRAAKTPRVRRAPTRVTPRLTPEGYVFPVYGPSSWSDDFGVPSRNPRIGWHHGIDIFAPLGAPLLAVNDGVVFSVGWNNLGGNRLWLRDDEGNQFYYAHLSAYSPLAVNGRRVRAGDVLGFVGNTGDARGGPYHLHFEVHPRGLLKLGYDGAVNPTPYLSGWQHLQDIKFPASIRAAGAWAPPVSSSSTAPAPGAILLQASDISQASGLQPRSLTRALAARAPGEAGRRLASGS